MNQLICHGPDDRRDNPANLAFVVALLSVILVTMLCAGNVIASTEQTAKTNANPDATHPATAFDDTTRQATITIDGKSSVHNYKSAFATTQSQVSGNQASNSNAAKSQTTNDQPVHAGPDRQIASYNPFLWIFDVALHLNTDHDHDGHYSNFSLTLDLDSTFTATSVYAVLYLANEGGPWNEYAITGNFTISGSGPGDTFSLNAELDSGYPSGYYNHYIEVYDTYTHELIGSYGPEDSHQLYGLPIESRMHDEEFTFGTDISLSFTGTGSLGPVPLLLIATFPVVWRRLKVSTKKGRMCHVRSS